MSTLFKAIIQVGNFDYFSGTGLLISAAYILIIAIMLVWFNSNKNEFRSKNKNHETQEMDEFFSTTKKIAIFCTIMTGLLLGILIFASIHTGKLNTSISYVGGVFILSGLLWIYLSIRHKKA